MSRTPARMRFGGGLGGGSAQAVTHLRAWSRWLARLQQREGKRRAMGNNVERPVPRAYTLHTTSALVPSQALARCHFRRHSSCTNSCVPLHEHGATSRDDVAPSKQNRQTAPASTCSFVATRSWGACVTGVPGCSCDIRPRPERSYRTRSRARCKALIAKSEGKDGWRVFSFAFTAYKKTIRNS